MPDYLIEDSQTGFKTLVEGDSPPTDEEASQLIDQAMQALTNKLHSLGGNRFMLDVGPLENSRKISDSLSSISKDFNKIIADQEGFNEGMKRANAIWEASTNKSSLNYKAVLDEQIAKAKQEAIGKVMKTLNSTERILSNLPENSLLVNAHGSEKGGLYTDDESIRFTLDNVAKLMGTNASTVNNLYNLACYTGQCRPANFQSAFPNLTNVVQGQTNAPNTISIENIAKGKYFAGDTTNIMRWIKRPDAVWERYDYKPQLKNEISYGEPPQYQPEE